MGLNGEEVLLDRVGSLRLPTLPCQRTNPDGVVYNLRLIPSSFSRAKQPHPYRVVSYLDSSTPFLLTTNSFLPYSL